MAKIVISDLDDTLVHDGIRMDNVYSYAKGLDGALVIVTGRDSAREEETKAELDRLNISYDELHMNDFAPAATLAFKKATAKKLLETHEVIVAIDNDPAVRSIYSDLGIHVLDPATIAPTGKANKMTEWVAATRAIELRAIPEAGDGNTFEGRACQYGVIDTYGTTFAPGCFTRGGLDTKPYALLWMHDPNRPVGVFTAEERMDGLYIVGRWDDSQAGREARAAAISGSAADLSVGFTWQVEASASDANLVTNARLMEVSQVTSRFGAVPGSVLTAIRTANMAAEEARAGRVLSAKNEESLRTAADLISGVLTQIADVAVKTKADDTDVETRSADEEVILGTVEAEEAELFNIELPADETTDEVEAVDAEDDLSDVVEDLQARNRARALSARARVL